MTGYILLAGGAEFGGRMAEPDRRAITLAGGPASAVRIIPAAAAPDRNHQRAGQNGVRWFGSLGCSDVAVLPLIDRSSANDPTIIGALHAARLIYLLGGFTHYLGETLRGSAAWQAIQAAHAAGAVLAGSSAGAMVLCEHYYDPGRGVLVTGLGLLPRSCVLPHHDTFGQSWAPRLVSLLPGVTLIGLDERTAILDDQAGSPRRWMAYGQGQVTLYRGGGIERYANGAGITL